MGNYKIRQSRLRSKVAWMSVVTLILLVCTTFGLFEKIGISENAAEDILILILSVLTGFGVFNDPTNKEGF